MTLKGFDQRWKDFPDYILGITRQIWEDREIASLHHYYSDDIIVRSPGSVVIGNRNVIAATMATLAEFPDRKLLGRRRNLLRICRTGIVVIASYIINGNPCQGWCLW